MIKAGMIFMYAETPLHPGAGTSLGVIDLPIQRERTTGYPMIQGSSLKGVLRDAAEEKGGIPEKRRQLRETERRLKNNPPDLAELRHQHATLAKEIAPCDAVFGPPAERASEHAGALSVTDARILLFPVRSLQGVFTWVTSPIALARLQRDLAFAGMPVGWGLPSVLSQPRVAPGCGCLAGERRIVLEEYGFDVVPDADEKGLVATVGGWLADNALPAGQDFQWWQAKVRTDLVILPEDDFRDFVTMATEVLARNKLTRVKTTGTNPTDDTDKGSLWYEEFLPAETVMYAMLTARPPRVPANGLQTEADVLRFSKNLGLDRVQIGGHETTGKGICKVQLLLNV